MFSKFGKEKKLFRNNNFRVKYGTIDAAKLAAIYIDVESWVQPTEIINFDSNIRLIRKKIINKLSETIDKDFFHDNFIVDLDLRSSGLSLTKKSFMFIEVTVYPKTVHKFNSDILIKKITEISGIIISEVQNNKYKFYSKK
jgi:hypothetical protein